MLSKNKMVQLKIFTREPYWQMTKDDPLACTKHGKDNDLPVLDTPGFARTQGQVWQVQFFC